MSAQPDIMSINYQNSFQALLIDLDGVIRHWPESDALLESSYGLPEGSFSEMAFAQDLLTLVITGHISDEVWREQITERLTRRYPEARAVEAVAEWSSYSGEIDFEVLALIESCVTVVRPTLVSNATSRLSQDLAVLGIDTRFHAIVNSSQIGIAKPEPGIFRFALQTAGANASSALFVDDSATNVAAAEQMGIHSHRFTSRDGLSLFLKEAEILRKNPQKLAANRPREAGRGPQFGSPPARLSV